MFFNVQKSMSRTKSKLNILTFVYTTLLPLLFKQQKVGGDLGIGKEIKPQTTFLLCSLYAVYTAIL